MIVIDVNPMGNYTFALMSASLPAVVDAWRLVAAKRIFKGSVGLQHFKRLLDLLDDDNGQCEYELTFDQDAFKRPYVDVHASAALPLQCQRTLERFFLPVQIQQRIGLIVSETQEASLDENMEPLLINEQGDLNLIELIEDELLLAVPAVPVRPGSEALDAVWPAKEVVTEPEKPNPFAALGALKTRKIRGE